MTPGALCWRKTHPKQKCTRILAWCCARAHPRRDEDELGRLLLALVGLILLGPVHHMKRGRLLLVDELLLAALRVAVCVRASIERSVTHRRERFGNR